MTTYFSQKVILAVKRRQRGAWYTNHELLARVVAHVGSLRPGEVPIQLNVKVPTSMFRGMGPVDVVIEEEAPEVSNDNAR